MWVTHNYHYILIMYWMQCCATSKFPHYCVNKIYEWQNISRVANYNMTMDEWGTIESPRLLEWIDVRDPGCIGLRDYFTY